mmetsp:Transcript_37112/g.97235  ORF Transcript_37112/g.97235 Transcript_37112/m.97235 type:complete len:210 (+) Transcript_37112:827-1456(+)
MSAANSKLPLPSRTADSSHVPEVTTLPWKVIWAKGSMVSLLGRPVTRPTRMHKACRGLSADGRLPSTSAASLRPPVPSCPLPCGDASGVPGPLDDPDSPRRRAGRLAGPLRSRECARPPGLPARPPGPPRSTGRHGVQARGVCAGDARPGVWGARRLSPTATVRTGMLSGTRSGCGKQDGTVWGAGRTMPWFMIVEKAWPLCRSGPWLW